MLGGIRCIKQMEVKLDDLSKKSGPRRDGIVCGEGSVWQEQI